MQGRGGANSPLTWWTAAVGVPPHDVPLLPQSLQQTRKENSSQTWADKQRHVGFPRYPWLYREDAIRIKLLIKSNGFISTLKCPT